MASKVNGQPPSFQEGNTCIHKRLREKSLDSTVSVIGKKKRTKTEPRDLRLGRSSGGCSSDTATVTPGRKIQRQEGVTALSVVKKRSGQWGTGPTPRKVHSVMAPVLPGGKRPQWDLKGKVEDMERKFEVNNTRLEMLEAEKSELETDAEIKREVVVKSSEEIQNLQIKVEERNQLLDTLRTELETKDEDHQRETVRLKKCIEEEALNIGRIQRKISTLEDELSVKQTELLGLKTSVAEMTSSRASVEASLTTFQNEAENTLSRVETLVKLCESQDIAMEETRRVKEKQLSKLCWEETERRRLHNVIQELKGNIRVFCRMRPLLEEELGDGEDIPHIHIRDETSLELNKSKDATTVSTVAGGLNKDIKFEFEFDRVFGPGDSQTEVFTELSQLVQSALDGYNVCVFAYGQTGSGKTFTMEGGQDTDQEQAGMIARTVRQIFETQERLEERGWKYRCQASYLEIYNEEIKDLLAMEKDLKYEIKSCDGKGSDLLVSNLRIEEVTTESQVASLRRRAAKVRAQARTLCNAHSSRSHAVFVLRLDGNNEVSGEKCCGTLSMVDLAGSERVKESGSEGIRLTEAQAINKSLSNLGNVIMALNQKSSHVPYRNSKLTHLLQNCLGGNSKTLMFVNISPREECFGETLNSLRFATAVNKCNIGTAQRRIK